MNNQYEISYLEPGQICLKKGNDGQILPADGDSAERYAQWPTGVEYVLGIKQMRNLGYHRKYFAMLNLAYKNQEVVEGKAWFREYVFKGIGYVNVYYAKDGTMLEKVKSISFLKCSQSKFEGIYQETLSFLINRFGFDENFVAELQSYS